MKVRVPDNRVIRLLKNAAIVFVGTAGSKLLVFLMMPFYTRYLAPDEYGLSDLVVVYGTMLVGLVSCQIQDAVFVFPKGKSRNEQSRHLTGGLVFLLVMLSLAALGCWVLKAGVPPTSFAGRYGWAVYFYLLGASLQGFFQQFCRGADKLVLYSVSGLVFSVVSVLSALFWIPRAPYGMTILYTQYLGFAAALLVSVVGGRLWRYLVRPRGCLKDLKAMLAYSIPLIPSAFMWWALSSLNRPFLEKFCGLASVGLYAAASKIPGVLSVAWGVVGNAWQISVLEEFRRPGYRGYYRKFSRCLCGGLLVVALGLSVAAPWYMRYVVGAEFYSAWTLVPILVSGMFFSGGGGARRGEFRRGPPKPLFLPVVGRRPDCDLCPERSVDPALRPCRCRVGECGGFGGRICRAAHLPVAPFQRGGIP